MSASGEALAVERIQTAGYRALEPFPGRVNLRWLMECTECGEQQRLRPDPKLKPCEHKERERQRRADEAEAKWRRDVLISAATRKLGTKNLRALEDHPGVEGALWWVECKYCGRKWHMREDQLRACPHKGTGDEGAPTPPPKPAPKRRAKKAAKPAPSFEYLHLRWTVPGLPDDRNAYRGRISCARWDAASTEEREQLVAEQREALAATVFRTTGVAVEAEGITYQVLDDRANAGPVRPGEEQLRREFDGPTA